MPFVKRSQSEKSQFQLQEKETPSLIIPRPQPDHMKWWNTSIMLLASCAETFDWASSWPARGTSCARPGASVSVCAVMCNTCAHWRNYGFVLNAAERVFVSVGYAKPAPPRQLRQRWPLYQEHTYSHICASHAQISVMTPFPWLSQQLFECLHLQVSIKRSLQEPSTLWGVVNNTVISSAHPNQKQCWLYLKPVTSEVRWYFQLLQNKTWQHDIQE